MWPCEIYHQLRPVCDTSSGAARCQYNQCTLLLTASRSGRDGSERASFHYVFGSSGDVGAGPSDASSADDAAIARPPPLLLLELVAALCAGCCCCCCCSFSGVCGGDGAVAVGGGADSGDGRVVAAVAATAAAASGGIEALRRCAPSSGPPTWFDVDAALLLSSFSFSPRRRLSSWISCAVRHIS